MERSQQIPTTLTALSAYLAHECYQPILYHIGSNWSACGDTYCIEHTQSGFEVFYVERGQRSSDLFVEQNESIACRRFLEILNQSLWSRAHCIAFSTDQEEIARIADVLTSAGIDTTRNDIPSYRATGDVRYRLFVLGRDHIKVDSLVAAGHIPSVVFS